MVTRVLLWEKTPPPGPWGVEPAVFPHLQTPSVDNLFFIFQPSKGRRTVTVLGFQEVPGQNWEEMGWKRAGQSKCWNKKNPDKVARCG